MLSNTKRTTIKKGAHKAVFEQEKLHQIIDESLIAHIALQGEHGPMVIPMLAWRVDDMVYIHGAKNSRLLKGLKKRRANLFNVHFVRWLGVSSFGISSQCALSFCCGVGVIFSHR